MARGVAILGATGSIGRQTLEVCSSRPDDFKVIALTAMNNIELLEEQARLFRPRMLIVGHPEQGRKLKKRLQDFPVKVLIGNSNLPEAVMHPEVEMVITAVSGSVGLVPTVEAIKAGKDIALANKETLVAAGQLVMNLVKNSGSKILPVDSEHSAIFQCLEGGRRHQVANLILTASGGPFRGWTKEKLAGVTPDQALKHPNWNMGAKITIDSATLMNKGLEVIEARFLFDMDYDQIKVVVHPQSIIHSMVEYWDGSIIAQLGTPDMRLPIQYALTWPERGKSSWPKLDFERLTHFTFEPPNVVNFPALRLAYAAGRQGGTLPAVLNAANEVAVSMFLNGVISFTDITKIVERVMEQHQIIYEPDLTTILGVDTEARQKVQELVNY